MAIGEVWSLDAKGVMVGVGVESAPVQAGQCLQRTIPGEGQIHSVCQPLTRQGEAWASARQEGIPVNTDLLTVIRSLETKVLTKNSKQSDLSWVASEAVLLQRVLDTETALASFCYSLKSSFYFSR